MTGSADTATLPTANGAAPNGSSPSSNVQSDGGTAAGSTAVSPEDRIAALTKTVESLAGSFKGLKDDFIRARHAKKSDGQESGESTAPGAAPNGANGAGRQFASQVRLAAEMATLPDAARDEIMAALESEEISIEQARDRATWLRKGMGLGATPNPPTAPRPAPPGVAGSAPHEPPAPSFTTREDWEKFKKENRGEAMRLLSTDFDPTVLPRRMTGR